MKRCYVQHHMSGKEKVQVCCLCVCLCVCVSVSVYVRQANFKEKRSLDDHPIQPDRYVELLVKIMALMMTPRKCTVTQVGW
jgi:hypothetical protein